MPMIDEDTLPSQRAAATMDEDTLPSQRGAVAVDEDTLPSQRAAIVIKAPAINPNAPGGFNYAGKNTKIAADSSLGEELDDLTEPIGRQLNTAGNVARGVLADAGGNIVSPMEGYHTANTKAAWNGEDMPMDADAKALPTALRVVNAGVQGMVKTAPNIALSMLNPVAGAASFGMTPDGFDVKQAAVAAALPVLGKYTGAITEALASKAGVTKDAALAIWNRIGGAAGAAGAIGADQLHSIMQLPADQRKDALIEAAGNVGSMFILGATGERTKLANTAAGKLVNKFRAPTAADALEAELAAPATQPDADTLPSQRGNTSPQPSPQSGEGENNLPPSPEATPNSQATPPPAEVATPPPAPAAAAPFNPNLKGDLSQLSEVMDDQHRQLMGAKIAAERAAAKAQLTPAPDGSTVIPAAPDAETITGQNGQTGPDASAVQAAPQMPAEGASSQTPGRPQSSIFIRPRSDGVPDILDAVQELGGLRPPGENAGGEYDGFRETMKGTARLLVNTSAKHTPDTIIHELHDLGEGTNFKRIQSPDDLYQAIQGAVQSRQKLRGNDREASVDAKRETQFQQKAIQGQRPKAQQNKIERVQGNDLLPGDSFEVQGHKFEVQHLEVDEHGGLQGVVVKDGPKFGVRTVGSGEFLHLDEGSFEAGPEHGEAAPTPIKPPKSEIGNRKSPSGAATVPTLRAGEKGTGEMFQGEDAPFNLAGERGTDGERIQREQETKAATAQAAKEFAARNQMEMAGGGSEAPPAGPLEDFGMKLGGARKDSPSITRDIPDKELAAMPLSQIWPKEEVDAIEDKRAGALAAAVRSIIPAKPRQSYKLSRWVETVKLCKELMAFAQNKGVDDVMTLMRSPKFRLEQFANKVDLLSAVDRASWDRIGDVKDYPDAYRYTDAGKEAAPFAEAKVDGRTVRATNLTELVDKVNEALGKAAPESKMEFEVRGREGSYFINKKGDPLYRKLKTFTDADAKAALKYRESNYDELVKAWEAVKEKENVKETDVRTEANRPRTGADYRQGKDATPRMFMDSFGFRGVEFGNWVQQGKNTRERQGMLNAAYDALHDLSNILKLPTKAISLNGTLGLGFGSRGHGWASAHYEPSTLVINLTKTRGAGTLAHEWFHAVDNYFQRKRGTTGSGRENHFTTYNPENYLEHPNGQRLPESQFKDLQARNRIRNTDEWQPVPGVAPEISQAFVGLTKALDESPMAKRAGLIDKGQSGGYWSRIIERAARSFENYSIAKMQEKGYHNDYLANVVRPEDFGRDPERYPYLRDNEVPPVAAAFDKLFSAISEKDNLEIPAKDNPGILGKAEAWANEVLRGGATHAGPDVLLAYAVKGAVIYAKGIRDFGKWSAEMLQQFGEEIKPHLQKVWEHAKTLVDDTGENGLSQRGMKIIADLNIDQGVREKINPVYRKLTDVSAKEQADALGLKYPTADGLAQDMLNGKFKDAPGGIEVALLAHTARRLADEQKLAERTGDTAKADALAQRQIDLLNRYREQSTDIAQALQKHQLLYENFSPAAWLKNFRDLVGKVASRRVERAGGLPQGSIDPSAHGVAKGIADRIAADLAQTHPRLGDAIGKTYGAKANGKSLVDNIIEQTGLTREAAAAKAKKIEDFYIKEAAQWRKRHNIPQFDNATEREVLQRAKAIDALPRDSVQRAVAVQDLQNWLTTKRGFEWWEPAREFWYANVLSGLTTAEKIFRSNALSAGAEIGLQMLRHPTAIPQILEATARSLPRSTAEAWRITKTGVSGRPGDVFDHSSWMETRKGVAAAVVWPWKMVFRTHHSLHAITYYPLEETKALVLSREAVKAQGVPLFGGALGKAAAEKMQWLGEQRKDAERQAQAEGLKPGGPLFSSRVDQILSQRRDKSVMVNAQHFAQMGTYVNDMYGMLGAAGDQFNRFAQQYPVARLVQPFVKIPINLFNGMLNWTPVGAYRAGRAQGFKLLIGREENTGQLYGREVTDPTAIGDLYAKSTIGTLATVGLMSAASAFINEPNPPFMVTARGPSDPNHRRLLEQAGWIPNSVKVGNTYIPYLDTPAGVVLAYIGHTMDALRYNKLDHDDALSRAMFAASSIRSVIFDSTWAQGLSALFDTSSYQSNKNLGEKATQQAIRTASGFVVPNLLKQLDQIYDPTVYKADDIRAMAMTQMPFARSNGEPDLNVFGEPVLNSLSSRILSRVQGDALTQTLAGRRIWPSVPLDPDLTPAEQRLILKVRGPQLRAQLMLNLPMLQALPQAQAQTLVNKISEETTRTAKENLGFDNLLRAKRGATR